MNKITTKLRIIRRLVGWLTLSVGMAIATSQTANAWVLVNESLTAPNDIAIVNEGSNVPSFWHLFQFPWQMLGGSQKSCDGATNSCGGGEGLVLNVEISYYSSQSGTVKSYTSTSDLRKINVAGKIVLKKDGYDWYANEYDLSPTESNIAYIW